MIERSSSHESFHPRPHACHRLSLTLSFCCRCFLHSLNSLNHIYEISLQFLELLFQFALGLRVHGIDLVLLACILFEMDNPVSEFVIVGLQVLIELILLVGVLLEAQDTLFENIILGLEEVAPGGKVGDSGGDIPNL